MFDDILGPKKKQKKVSFNLMGNVVPKEKYDRAMEQLWKLTTFLLEEFPGECANGRVGSGVGKKPPVDVAIHLLKYYKDL